MSQVSIKRKVSSDSFMPTAKKRKQLEGNSTEDDRGKRFENLLKQTELFAKTIMISDNKTTTPIKSNKGRQKRNKESDTNNSNR